MAYSKTDYLNSLQKPDLDMVGFTKFMLPYKVKGWTTYNLITALDVNHGGTIDKVSLESGIKDIYTIWYNYVCGLDESLYSGDTIRAITTIKNNPLFHPSNVSPEKSRTFMEHGYNKWFKGAGLRPMDPQGKGGIVFEGEVADDFIHIFPFGQPVGGVGCRLYLNIKPEYRVRLAVALTESAYNNGFRFYGKLWTGGQRNDGFVIYTNYLRLHEMDKILKEVRASEPYLFEGADKGNPLLAKVDDCVRFGEEPNYKHTSFNKERAEAVDEFLDEVLSSVYQKIGNYTGTMYTSEGDTVDFKGYLDYRIEKSFRETLAKKQTDIANGIYPSNVRPQDISKYIRAENAIYNHLRGEFPQYIKDQIVEQREYVIKRLKEGKKPYLRAITVRTQGDDFNLHLDKDYAKKLQANLGYFPYNEGIDYDIGAKLLNVFGAEEQINRLITESNLKPYFDKHHVSIKRPHLNLETEEDMGDLLTF